LPAPHRQGGMDTEWTHGLAVYPAPVPKSIAWPEPVESLSRHLSCGGRQVVRARRRDVALPDRLFMAGRASSGARHRL